MKFLIFFIQYLVMTPILRFFIEKLVAILFFYLIYKYILKPVLFS